MVRSRHVLAITALLAPPALLSGCGWIIGLDEFTDQPPPGDGGGGQGGGAAGGCAAAADCPGGEHATPICEAGACGLQCEDGFADCDDAPGCETDTTGDRSNCGGCGIVCGAFCEASACNDPVSITAGYNHTCALLQDGSAWCWGANKDGQLGDGTTEDRTTPTRVLLPEGEAAIEIAAGGDKPQPDVAETGHTCAVLADHSVTCWGANSRGQIGDGSMTDRANPVSLSLIDVEHVTTGGQHTCATTTNHDIFCWGANSYGQIGNGTNQTAPEPVQLGISSALISAGKGHTCAIASNGLLRCWGRNAFGQLGIGVQGDALTPTLVNGIDELIQIAAGAGHTCARRSVGAYCWGNASVGQLGLGDLIPHDTPQPLTLPSIDFIAVGASHSGAITGNTIYMWGSNSDGQLGDGTVVNTPTPQSIDLNGATMLALGFQHSCGLTNLRTVLCWGANGHGQLGDGSMTSKGIPIPVRWP